VDCTAGGSPARIEPDRLAMSFWRRGRPLFARLGKLISRLESLGIVYDAISPPMPVLPAQCRDDILVK